MLRECRSLVTKNGGFNYKNNYPCQGTAFLVIFLTWLIGAGGVSQAFAGLASLESPLIIVDNQHVDIEVPLIGGQWTPSVRAWYDGNLSPEQSILHFNENTRTVRSSWESWIGAADGEPVWIVEQSSIPNELWLGFAARGCDSLGTWLPDDSRLSSIPFQYIQINLLDVRGFDGDDDPGNNPSAPGDFALWETGSFGTKVPWFSTAETLPDGNRTYMLPGGHSHFNWAFTAEGMYEIDLQLMAYLGPGQTNQTVSPVLTFYFGVERPFPGDANIDDQVDSADAKALALNWGESSSQIGWLEGDFNADRVVDAADVSIMAANWSCSSGEATAAPEPGVVSLLLAGAVFCFFTRCKRENRLYV